MRERVRQREVIAGEYKRVQAEDRRPKRKSG